MNQSHSPGALYAALGAALFRVGRHKEAAEALGNALAEPATDFDYEQASRTLNEVQRALMSTKGDELLDALVKEPETPTPLSALPTSLSILLESSPDDAETQEALGWALLYQKTVAQSLSAFKRATALAT